MVYSWFVVSTHYGTALRKQSSVFVSANQAKGSCVSYSGAVFELESFEAVKSPGNREQILAGSGKLVEISLISLVCFIAIFSSSH